jgi:NAD(P)-dependent dehydrogenase (short-subunit alcohol dehydrogenase family)
VAIVTGGNTGVGYETTLQLALRKAKVYIAARSSTKAADAISKIKSLDPSAQVEYLPLDLANLESVRSAVDKFLREEEKLDILICNGGIIAQEFCLAENGIELTFQTNYLGFSLCFRLF